MNERADAAATSGHPTRGPAFHWMEIVTGGALLLLCLLVASTQFVNPFPHDGWFESQYRIFGRFPGTDNYSPIAAPAFLYASIHRVAVLTGQGLEAEFYLGSLIQNLMVFLSGGFLYLAHAQLGMRRCGLVVTSIMVVFIESTFLPQAFWSENATLFLNAVTLPVLLHLYGHHEELGRRWFVWCILLGGVIGLSVITRIVPVLLLPALFLLLVSRRSLRSVAPVTLVTSGTVLLIVGLAMTANLYRFGRFELSHSIGRHLWNAISPNAETMLAESARYESLKTVDPDIQGKTWWEVQINDSPESGNLFREEVLGTLAFEAIRSHPGLFLRAGLRDTWETLGRAPGQIGLLRADYSNPLNRSTMLPALRVPWPGLLAFLNRAHRTGAWFYPIVVWGALMAGLLGVMGRLAFGWRGGSSADDRAVRFWLFFASVFVGSMYVSWQIESEHARFAIPYLPVLALMVSSSIHSVTGRR